MSQLGDSPAFPLLEQNPPGIQTRIWQGLTIHQHYAGLAMQGLRSNPNCWEYSSQDLSKYAVADADALIKELEQR